MAFIVETEPVYIEDLRSLIAQHVAHFKPVLEIVAHMVAAEGQHSHRVTADNAYGAGSGGGGLRGHNRAYEHAVGPVTGLIYQRSGLSAAAAKDDGGNRNAAGGIELIADTGAVLRGSGETAVGMGALFLRGLAVPGLALPVESMLRRILIQALPPNGIVIQILHHVGKDGALLGGNQSVGIGLHVSAGGNAEEAVLRVDGPQAAVGALAHPSDIIANGPNLVALLLIALRRNQHGQVGLAAGRREGGGHILLLALGILDAQDQHMLGHPALVFAQVRGDTESEALFAQQNVSAVAGVYRDNGIVLREVHDISLLSVNVAFAVEALNPIGAVAQGIPNLLSHSGHDGHVQHNVNRIGELHADFGQRRTYRTHGIRNDIHSAALVAAAGNVIQHFISLFRIHPVVGGARILFLFGADHGAVLYTGHVVNSGAVQIAARQLLLIQLMHFASGTSFGTQGLQLLLGTVNPYQLVGLHELFHLVNPSKNRLVCCHNCFPFPPQWARGMFLHLWFHIIWYYYTRLPEIYQ